MFFASQSILQKGADKLESQLHNLEETLSNERAEFKRAIAVLKEEMVDRISFVVIENFSDVVPTSAEVGRDFVGDCFRMVVWRLLMLSLVSLFI